MSDCNFRYRLVLLAVLVSADTAGTALAQSVAAQWNARLLNAIRVDTPRPTVHARNLFHTSAAMYDAWAAYDPIAVGYLYNGRATGDLAAREVAISYAAYGVLRHRFANSPGAATSLATFGQQMHSLGLDPYDTSTLGDSPAAVGNRVAAAYVMQTLSDRSNESGNYEDTTGYVPVNPPLIVAGQGASLNDPNRWQPLTIQVNGTPTTQQFLTPHWGGVEPFAVTRQSPGVAYGAELVSPPPAFGTNAFKQDAIEVLELSARLDANLSEQIDISPSARGNNPLASNAGLGHAMNPTTGQPYAPNIVNHGDWGRVLAEFWADGPNSETPPGHWNAIATDASYHPLAGRRIGGVGPEVDDLAWDVQLHFTLNAALHDAAIVAWDHKLREDYVRPISMIRYMGQLGQSSDPSDPSYHADGLPLVAGLVELVTAATAAAGGRHEGLTPGEVAIFAWLGHTLDGSPAGVGWLEADAWLPYQAEDFVTPAFAGYVSGHSTFSRAAAEVLTAFTGDAYFPGGYGEYLYAAGFGLNFENGPSQDVRLQWATYFDAADEAGLSRLYGGIHPRADDSDGRILGSYVGVAAWDKAQRYFNGTIPEPSSGVLVAIATVLLAPLRRQAKSQWLL